MTSALRSRASGGLALDGALPTFTEVSPGAAEATGASTLPAGRQASGVA